jgi:dipeptidyl aminopeptidase/acylaminoacyl peptidase
MRGLPWEVPEKMRAMSPITYVADVTTPTLVLHADHDRRCPLAMGTMWYRALKKAGVETEMVVYHDERHGLYQLPHQEDVYRRTLAWFAKYDTAAPNSSNQSPSNQPSRK